MASLDEKIPMPLTMEALEVMAARNATIFNEELGLRRVIFEGDLELVVKALLGDYLDWSCIGHIVKDCKSIMSFFQTCSFSHVRWQNSLVSIEFIS